MKTLMFVRHLTFCQTKESLFGVWSVFYKIQLIIWFLTNNLFSLLAYLIRSSSKYKLKLPVFLSALIYKVLRILGTQNNLSWESRSYQVHKAFSKIKF